jgi:hypothetical protein
MIQQILEPLDCPSPYSSASIRRGAFGGEQASCGRSSIALRKSRIAVGKSDLPAKDHQGQGGVGGSVEG